MPARCGRKSAKRDVYKRQEIAHQYEVTYPTVRLRLDRLIQKIKISEETENDPYVALIKSCLLYTSRCV